MRGNKEFTAYLVESTTRPGTWLCSLDLDWLDDGEGHKAGDAVGWIEVFGKTRFDAAKAMVSFLHTMGSIRTIWILDEDERDYCTVDFNGNDKPRVRIPVWDRNHGRGKTAWTEGKNERV